MGHCPMVPDCLGLCPMVDISVCNYFVYLLLYKMVVKMR